MLICAPAANLTPAAGLDPSWQLALNTYRRSGLRWGPDLLFTYGPWGSVDFPLATSRLDLTVALLISCFAIAGAWLALFDLLRPAVRSIPAAVVASVLVMWVNQTSTTSTLLFIAAAGLALDHLARPRPGPGTWVPATVAAVAAFATEIKFSTGVFLTAIALVCVVCTPARRWLRLAAAASSWALVTVLGWLVAGQTLGNYPSWFSGSVQLSRGYTEAMALEEKPNVLQYLLIAALVLTVTGYLLRLRRGPVSGSALGIALVSVLALYLGLREATGRHSPGHSNAVFVFAVPVLAAAVVWGRSVRFRGAVLLVVAALGANTWLPVEPSVVQSRWGQEMQLAVDSEYRASYLRQAQLQARATYSLSPALLAAVGRHPMTVDSFDASVAWAYDLDWHPAPVFQTYAAYTPALDSRNAAAIAHAPADETILRSAIGTIDGRQALWDSPRYVLAEICGYRPVTSDPHWLVLRKAGADRCGTPAVVSRLRVRPGRPVPVPAGRADQLVVMSFAADPPPVLVRAGRLALKSFHPLTVRTPNRLSVPYRLPRALAGGPLLVRIGADSGWSPSFQQGSPFDSVAFSEPGQVSFSVINLR